MGPVVVAFGVALAWAARRDADADGEAVRVADAGEDSVAVGDATGDGLAGAGDVGVAVGVL